MVLDSTWEPEYFATNVVRESRHSYFSYFQPTPYKSEHGTDDFPGPCVRLWRVAGCHVISHADGGTDLFACFDASRCSCFKFGRRLPELSDCTMEVRVGNLKTFIHAFGH